MMTSSSHQGSTNGVILDEATGNYYCLSWTKAQRDALGAKEYSTEVEAYFNAKVDLCVD